MIHSYRKDDILNASRADLLDMIESHGLRVDTTADDYTLAHLVVIELCLRHRLRV